MAEDLVLSMDILHFRLWVLKRLVMYSPLRCSDRSAAAHVEIVRPKAIALNKVMH